VGKVPSPLQGLLRRQRWKELRRNEPQGLAVSNKNLGTLAATPAGSVSRAYQETVGHVVMEVEASPSPGEMVTPGKEKI